MKVRSLIARVPVLALMLALLPIGAGTVSAQIQVPTQLPSAPVGVNPCEQVHCVINPEITRFPQPAGGLAGRNESTIRLNPREGRRDRSELKRSR